MGKVWFYVLFACACASAIMQTRKNLKWPIPTLHQPPTLSPLNEVRRALHPWRPQRFQMNWYISHWFLKLLFWYFLNFYGKLHLLVWKFIQKGHWKGPKKGLKKVNFTNWENIHIFSKWIDRLCAPQYSKIYRFIWRRMCVITHSFLKSVRFWRI